MEAENAEMFANSDQSDPEETEDEEVKRNCIMGQSGMRDSDFSDSDFDEEEEELEEKEGTAPVDDNNGNEEAGASGDSNKDETEELVKFVTIGSQIIKPNGVVLYRPKPVLLTPPLEVITANQKGGSMKVPEVISDRLIGDVNAKSGFSSPSKEDVETDTPATYCNSDTDGSDADTESINSDEQTKSSPVDFPFTDGEDLSGLEVVEGPGRIAEDTDEGCCDSSYDEDQHEGMSESYALVGASGASVDDKWETAKQKRVLSSNTLSALNAEANHDEDCLKRRRGLEQSFRDFCSIPEITLGVEALDQIIQPLPRQYIIRDDSPLMTSCNEKEEDEMLSEELTEGFQNSGTICNGDHSIIPLLTPPQSPRTVDDTFEGHAMIAIEWPSNLVMDTTIMTACADVSQIFTSSNNGENLMNDTPTSKNTTRLRTISIATT
eukprot:jgi/Psemu1/63443/estExt_Genemark1.C_270033